MKKMRLSCICIKLTCDRTPTQFGLNTLDEIFEEFKGRCLINIDKFWLNPAGIIDCISRHGITEQVLVKGAATPPLIDVLEDLGQDIPYMTILREGEADPTPELKNRKLAYRAQELIFTSKTSAFVSGDYIEKLHKAGLGSYRAPSCLY